MFALMTESNGSLDLESDEASCWRYFSERMASSPRTAYSAALTWGLMLSMFRLRRGVVVDMVRWWEGCGKGE